MLQSGYFVYLLLFAMITLQTDQAIAYGGEKLVFAHPRHPDRLIKLISPKFVRYMNKAWPYSTRFRRIQYHWSFINELKEHVFSREKQLPHPEYLQDIIGLTDTSLGIGMVVTAIRKSNGELADTLSTIIDQGRYSEEHAKALEQLLQWIEEQYIVIRDLATHNLVWHEQAGHFVIIDGIGARRLPSLRSISRSYNQRSNRKRTAKLRLRVNRQLAKYQQQSNRESLA